MDAKTRWQKLKSYFPLSLRGWIFYVAAMGLASLFTGGLIEYQNDGTSGKIAPDQNRETDEERLAG